MKRGLTSAIRSAPMQVNTPFRNPRPAAVQEPLKAHLEAATSRYRSQRGTRAPFTDCLTSGETGKLQNLAAKCPL